MAYTTTITFPVQNISPTETIQLILEFNTDLTGSNRVWASADYNLRVLSYGKREASYDLEDAFMVPGKTSMIIGDPDGVLDDLLFGAGAITVATDKQAMVTKKINGVTKFIGTMIEDSIEFDVASKIIKFDAAPKTDVINKRMVYDEDGAPLNPLGASGVYERVIELLAKAYRLVNPSISASPLSLRITNDFVFKGVRAPGDDGARLNDISISELLEQTTPLFWDNSQGLSNCGDLLRKLAIDWCSFTGLLSYDNPFFKRLFHYNPDNLQTVNVQSRKKGYRYGLIDYVEVDNILSDIDPSAPYTRGTFTKLQDRFLSRKSLPAYFCSGAAIGSNVFADIQRDGYGTNYFVFNTGSTNISPYPEEGDRYNHDPANEILGYLEVVGTRFPYETSDIYTITLKQVGSFLNMPPNSGTLTRVTGAGQTPITYTSKRNADGFYTIYQARCPDLLNNEFNNHGELLAEFWYKYRGTLANCRVDKFVLRGIDYDFLKDFNYDGSKYQPISMTHYDSEGYTECEAICLGDL